MSLFGPSQKETWTKLSEEVKAKFINGGTWNSNKVEVHEKESTLTLDTFAVHAGKVTVPFTRVRAPFMMKDGFRFKIERRNFFSPVADFFGRKNLSVGYAEFDKHFVITGTDEYKLKKLFASEAIREFILEQKEIHLEIKDDEGGWPNKKFPSDVDELYFQTSGVVKDVERLKLVFSLIKEVLNQLVTIGSAYDRNPNVTLK
jgi:hypothetical protein